jgi:succinyl-CoA synthetase beta subunit
VNAVLVEDSVEATRELYFGILIDTTARVPIIIASSAGGMEIEETAAKDPDRVLRLHIDPLTGVLPYQGRNLTYGLGLSNEFSATMSSIARGAYRLFVEQDCSLVEINPLIVTADGRVLALDAKVTLDDSALYKHPELAALRDRSQEDPLDAKAADVGINYIKLDGTIGCLVNGAGLAMATMDLVKWAGGEPANFLDVGGGASQEQLVAAIEMMLSDSDVKAAWVNIFGGILRCDLLASAIVEVLSRRDTRVPFIVRMNGTNLEEGLEILKKSGLPITFKEDLAEAAGAAVSAAQAGGQAR